MYDVEQFLVKRGATVRSTLEQQDRVGLGVLLIVDQEGIFERTLTDGDLRRLILSGAELDEDLSGLDSITAITLTPSSTELEAMTLMNRYEIDHIPVLDEKGRPVKVITRKDLDSKIHLSRPHLGGKELGYVRDALDSNWVAPLGPNVDSFEREIAEYVGVSSAAAVVSGTAAIHLALRLLGVGAGDRVICSSLTFVASANPILYVGAEPVFVDSEPETWNMSPTALRTALEDCARSDKPAKAVIVVNLYGQSADFEQIRALCDEYGAPIVEDAAESLGATYKGKMSGSFGDIAVLSFNGNKIITTSGGGMLLADNAEVVTKARFLSTQARDKAIHYEHSEIGYNYRMSNVLAGIGRGQLDILDERVQQRRQVFSWYEERLADVKGLTWMPEASFGKMTRWLTAATVDERAAGTAASLIEHLGKCDIEARPVWKPMHLQPLYSGNRYFEHVSGHSVADELFGKGICFPSTSDLSEEQVDMIAGEIRNHLLA